MNTESSILFSQLWSYFRLCRHQSLQHNTGRVGFQKGGQESQEVTTKENLVNFHQLSARLLYPGLITVTTKEQKPPSNEGNHKINHIKSSLERTREDSLPQTHAVGPKPHGYSACCSKTPGYRAHSDQTTPIQTALCLPNGMQ